MATEERLLRLENAFATLVELTRKYYGSAPERAKRTRCLQKQTEAMIRELVESQKRTDEQVRQTGEAVRELTDNRNRTDELLHSLAVLIERHFRADRRE